MSDDTELTGITPVPPEGGPAPQSGGGFFSSTAGKVLIIGGAIAILLLIAGVALVIVLGSSLLSGVTGGGTGAVGTGTPTPTTSSVPTSSSAVSTGAILPVSDIENRDVFSPRDPFKPIDAPKLAVETVSGTGGTTNDKTLVLNDITTENGVKKAVITYSGTSYTLGEGDSVPNSPWKVLKIYTSSVVMLYGDDRVTLTVGQGITK